MSDSAQEDFEEFEINLAKEHNLTPKEIRKLRNQAQTPWAGATIAHFRFQALLRQLSAEKKKSQDYEVKSIPERLLNVFYDYLYLTDLSKEEIDQEVFYKNEAVARLSMHSSEVRRKAGIRRRTKQDNGKYVLTPADWIDEIYEISSGNGNRVWTTRGGSKYHKSRDCVALLDGQGKANAEGKDTYNPQFIIREEAMRYGKKACLVCKPE